MENGNKITITGKVISVTPMTLHSSKTFGDYRFDFTVEDDSGRAFDCFEDLPNLPNTLTMKNHKQQVHKGDKVKVRLIFNKRRRNDIPDFELCALEVL